MLNYIVIFLKIGIKSQETNIMKFITILCIVFISIFISTCKSSQDDIYEFDPRLIEINKINLSEIGDEVTYLPLDNSFPIGTIYDDIKYVNNTIYFSSKDIGLLVFDKNGAAIMKVGSIGRGPGEYSIYSDFTIDKRTGTIYLNDRGNIIKVYSRTGKYNRSFSLKEYGNVNAIEFHNSNLLVTFSIQYDNAEYKWVVFDTLGNVIKRKVREMPIFTASYGGHEGISKFENNAMYWNQYTDTVFSILPDLNEEPTLVISSGEHRIPKSKLTLEQILQWKYMSVHQIFETSRFFIIEYFYNKRTILLIDKHNLESYSTVIETEVSNNSTNEYSGIFNDIDGGVSFFPRNYFADLGREYLISLIYPYQIKAQTNSNEFKSFIPKYPKKKNEFEKLAASLKETDNPVLMIVRLKK